MLAVFLGNEPTLGGDFVPCPMAQLDDGKLDICLIRHDADTPYLQLFRAMAAGAHLEYTRHVWYGQTSGELKLEFDREIPILVDGDLKTAARSYRLEVLPDRFAIVVG